MRKATRSLRELGTCKRRRMRSSTAGGAPSTKRCVPRKASEEAAATIALAHATVASERAQAIEKQGPFVGELARTMAQRALSIERVA